MNFVFLFNPIYYNVLNKAVAFGLDYYSAKVKVLVADSDDYYSATSRGLECFEPVVVRFDKELSINGRVKRLE